MSWSFWRRRDKRERELEEEIGSHLRMAAGERQAQGASASEAECQAKRELGNVGLVKEVTRGTWGWTWPERLAQDVRYGFRSLRKSPLMAAVAILSLALGIGANTAIFSLINAVMLKDLPVRNPQELVLMGDPTRTGGLSKSSGGQLDLLSYPFFEGLRERNKVFADVSAHSRTEALEVSSGSGAHGRSGALERAKCRFVSGNYFSLLGVPAALGRVFQESEVRVTGSAQVAVISEGYWERQLARAPDAVGRRLMVNGYELTIIGIMPNGFFGDTVGQPTDMWIPASVIAQAMPGRSYLKNTGVHWLLLMGRLKPGISFAQAAASVKVLSQQICRELYQNSPRNEFEELLQQQIKVTPGAKGFSRIRHDFSTPLTMLMGTTALVLLICCANVANLQLARAAARRREIGLRLALGAGQFRLLRQLLTESLLLAGMGAALALPAALWASRLLVRMTANGGHAPLEVQLDATVLLFKGGVALLAGLLFGLAPAWQGRNVDLVASLKESKAGAGTGFAKGIGKMLVVSQVILSLVLLVGAGVCIQTLRNLRELDVGYQRGGLLLAQVDYTTAGYSGKAVDRLAERVLEKLRQMPGVAAATVSENGLFSGTDSTSDAAIEGYTPHGDADRSNHMDRVGADYFSVTGTRLLAGRGIEARDVPGAMPVAVINEKMAEFYFPHGNALGRHITGEHAGGKTNYTIVGIARDVHESKLREPVPRRYYLSYRQHDDDLDGMHFEVRTRQETAAFAPAVRNAIKQVDSRLPINSLESANGLIEENLDAEKLVAQLASFFGLLALVLAGIGLYGVFAYMTARRTTEIGIRMALGAERGAVTRMLLGETMLDVGMGVVAGTLLSLGLTTLLRNMLFGVAVFEPLTLCAAAAVIIFTALAATYLPARRAARTDPTIALRYE